MSDDELVRRLLAEARHDEPIPADVAARLDAAIAGLVADRPDASAADEPSPDVPSLADRRASRRKGWIGLGLVAAAAAVVGGIAVGQSLQTPGHDASTAGAADSGGDSAGSFSEGSAADPRVVEGYLRYGVHPLSSERLAADVPALVDGLAGEKRVDGSGSLVAVDFPCQPADWGPGELVPVLLDREPAVLVLRPADGDRQQADVLACGSGAVLASVPVRQR